jgi:Domain of unknown function (DUF4258)
LAPYKYSKHARMRLRVRRVSKHQVVATIGDPDASYEDVGSATLVAVKRMNGNHLVVLYVVEEKETRVVTVYHASSVDRLINRKLKRGVWKVRA